MINFHSKTLGTSLLVCALLVSVVFGGVALANAQTTMTMPVLYNQSGSAVNTGSGNLGAGWYYLQSDGVSGQVYYYGNGTYYDQSMRLYGGSVLNPTGRAGTFTIGPSTPGVPNTGSGGEAGINWLVLLVAAAVLAGTAVYATRRMAGVR